MTIEFDDNGKFFTNIVQKEPVPAIIQTTAHRIHGTIHVSRERRLKDELDVPEKFLAVTDVTVFSSDGQVLHQAGFLAIRRDQVVWILPDNELSDTTKDNAE